MLLAIKGLTNKMLLAHPMLQTSSAPVIQRGTELTAAQAKADEDAATAAASRSVVDRLIKDYDKDLGVFLFNVERVLPKTEDLEDLSLEEATRAAYAFLPPSGITAEWDPITKILTCKIERAEGIPTCVVEMSDEPTNPTTWKRLKGFGTVKRLKDLPPGVYWFRAATARADDESAFTTPIRVVVS